MGRKVTLRHALVVATLLNAIVLMLVAVALVNSYDHRLGAARQTVQNLSHVLEENLSRTIEKVDLTLLAVIDEIETEERGGGIDPTALTRSLRIHGARLPEALGLRVVDADGNLEYAEGNVAVPNATVADRDFFIRLRDNPDLGLVISPPVVGRVSAQPLIILARRRFGTDGGFRGTVHASVPISSLVAILSKVDLGPHGNTTLWNGAPELLARLNGAPAIGTLVLPSPALRDLILGQSEPTLYQARSGVDGVERQFYFQRVVPWPLYLVVGMADADILAEWWREAAMLGAVTLLFMMASVVSALVVHRTMHQQEQARDEADAARRHGDLILASVGEGICRVDPAGNLAYLNPAARRMLRWGDDDALGGSFHAAIHHHRSDGLPCPADQCPMHKMLRGGVGPQHIEDEFYWRRDGTCFPVEYTLAPVARPDGAVEVVNIFRDVTERKQAQAEINRLLSRQKAVLRNTPVGIAIIDFNRTIIEANDAFCRVFGHDYDAIIGKSARILYADPQQYDDIGRRAYPKVMQGEAFCDDVLMVRVDGSSVWARLVAHLVDLDTPELGVVWAAEDITERKALEFDLKRSNADLEQFAYVASHDLRQPLRMVSSYLGMIKVELGDILTGDLRTYFDFAITGAKRMDRLILDLLEYSRTGRSSVEVAVGLDEAVAEALLNLRPMISDCGVQITVAEGLPTVIGHQSDLARLFQNLIGNAIKYRAPDRPPTVTVGWCDGGSEWRISVEDNGIGIEPEHRERAFQIFQRLVSKDQYEGTGIGLAVCKKIVENHHGQIWIELTDAGVGSRFVFTLPKSVER